MFKNYKNLIKSPIKKINWEMTNSRLAGENDRLAGENAWLTKENAGLNCAEMAD